MQEDYNEEDYLVHYGVLGMKWGVRKSRSNSSSGSKRKKLTKKVTSKVSKIYSNSKKKRKAKKLEKAREKKFKKEKKKRISQLTDAELNKRIARLELEKKYKNLQKDRMSNGAKYLSRIADKSIDNIGTQLGTYGLGQLVNKVAGYDIVNPKKGQKDK